jgi:hypothetical protein
MLRRGRSAYPAVGATQGLITLGSKGAIRSIPWQQLESLIFGTTKRAGELLRLPTDRALGSFIFRTSGASTGTGTLSLGAPSHLNGPTISARTGASGVSRGFALSGPLAIRATRHESGERGHALGFLCRPSLSTNRQYVTMTQSCGCSLYGIKTLSLTPLRLAYRTRDRLTRRIGHSNRRLGSGPSRLRESIHRRARRTDSSQSEHREGYL